MITKKHSSLIFALFLVMSLAHNGFAQEGDTGGESDPNPPDYSEQDSGGDVAPVDPKDDYSDSGHNPGNDIPEPPEQDGGEGAIIEEGHSDPE